MSLQGSKTRRISRVAALVAAGFVLSVLWATVAQAQAASNRYSLSGNTRAQIGSLVLPFTTAAAPTGAVALTGGYVLQDAAQADPKDVYLVDNLTTTLFSQPTPKTQGLFFANTKVFQVRTSLVVTGAKGNATNGSNVITFKAGGRSGAPTFAWCPGQPAANITGAVNISPCTNPATQGSLTLRVSYTKAALGVQFGGPSQAKLNPALQGTKGGASLVANVGAITAGACNHPAIPNTTGVTTTACIGAFGPIAVASTGVAGCPIGGAGCWPYIQITMTGSPPTMTNPPVPPIKPVAVNATGTVQSVGATTIAPFINNRVVASYGFPFTTGMVTVEAPTAVPVEKFTLTGSDNRVDGMGSLSLVSGGVSMRVVTGPNGNQSWLNYVIGGGAAAPSISTGGLVLLSALMLGVAVWMVRRSVLAS